MEEKDNQMFVERFRPVNRKQIILLPRIANMVDNILQEGLNQHLLLTGPPGMGKTSLARIIAKTLYPKQYMEINSSDSSSVEVLRQNISEFCKSATGGLFSDGKVERLVYIDEFDGMSNKFKEDLRGFIERYQKYACFIVTCNSTQTIPEAIISRFKVIDFEPQDYEERKWLQRKYITWLNHICTKKLDWPSDKSDLKTKLKEIIEVYFPDFRACYQQLQACYISNKWLAVGTNLPMTLAVELYELILNPTSPEDNYDWLLTTVKKDQYAMIIKQLGQPFIAYCQKKYPQYNHLWPHWIIQTAHYQHQSLNSVDPFINLLALIYKLQEPLLK